MRVSYFMFLFVSILLFSGAGYSGLPQSGEKWNENVWSKYLAYHLKGVDQYQTADGSRVDILTDTHACEVDWLPKWPEGVGQCLFYAIQTDRKPCLILIIRKPEKSQRYLRRVRQVCDKYDIKLILEYAHAETKRPIGTSIRDSP